MAGHSKWKQIKRKKAVTDKRRGAMYSKHLAAITAAVRSGGSGDPSANLSLKNSLSLAKRDGVPVDTINKAIEKALGAAEGSSLDEVVYEGYGAAGVAIMVYALTDNRNRTVGEVRHAFTKYGGNMSGGVAWMFNRKGLITLAKNDETTQELAIDLGADDFEAYEEDGEERLDVYTAFEDMLQVAEGFRKAGLEPLGAEFTSVTDNMMELNASDAGKVARLLEALEELDDVQNVYSNANFDALEDEAS
jgi:YebC/PmpR family DNA-binding regulatory protein